MTRLALLGGDAVFPGQLPVYNSLGKYEEQAVIDVVRSGCLSGFYGSWEDGFLGGKKVQEFEAAWAEKYKSKHVISVNSNTSGLYAAVGAAGVGPGDEVIVPCTTMSATAMAPLIYGGIPVFADLDENTFCISFDSVVANLTEKTKAIIAVNLFGQAAPLAQLRQLCDERGIILIEDNAQAPLATENNIFCGTIGHIGVFSLNYHKHIHTGEGGMCCTDDDTLAERLQLIRNHAEAVVGPAGVKSLVNMVGFNFRLTELSAAVGLVQLENIEKHVGIRQDLAESLTAGVQDLEGITAPLVRTGCRHVYYDWIIRFDEQKLGISRAIFVKALQQEGFPCFSGYVQPLYMLPLFQQRTAIGENHFPFNLTERTYKKGLCPVAEQLYQSEIIGVETCAYDVNNDAMDRLIGAFRKVHQNIDELSRWEQKQ